MLNVQVLSGSEWGNILVWALGSIKVEVSQRGRKNCHSAEISQIIYNAVTNEVITVGKYEFCSHSVTSILHWRLCCYITIYVIYDF